MLHRMALRIRIPAGLAVLLLGLPLALGCTSVVYRVGTALLYREATLPADRMLLDVPYRLGADADPHKHRLDLFLPAEADASGWPVMVFVHGGGWTHGDRALEAGGADVYRNIGRFFASQGIGVASISYRLQPAVDWRSQVQDVARAIAWVQQHIGAYGGDPGAIFVAGHSAGAQLAAHVALGTAAELGVPLPQPVCGLIPVSGAAFDLEDQETYALGASPDYYEERFNRAGEDPAWQRSASPVRRVREGAPPSLVLYAAGESAPLQHQARVLDTALRRAGAHSRVVVVPGEDHMRIVLTLSRADKTAAPAMLAFIRDTRCNAPRAGAD